MPYHWWLLSLPLFALLVIVRKPVLVPLVARIKPLFTRKNDMFHKKRVQCLIACLLLLAPSLVFAASPFTDLSETHWSYSYVLKSVDDGILQGNGGKFEGQRQLDRYQIAVVTSRLLDKIMPNNYVELQRGLLSHETLMETLEEELEVVQHRLSTLDNEFLELSRERGKADSVGNMDVPFTAFASFGLVKSDDQNNGIPYTRFAEQGHTLFHSSPGKPWCGQRSNQGCLLPWPIRLWQPDKRWQWSDRQ